MSIVTTGVDPSTPSEQAESGRTLQGPFPLAENFIDRIRLLGDNTMLRVTFRISDYHHGRVTLQWCFLKEMQRLGILGGQCERYTETTPQIFGISRQVCTTGTSFVLEVPVSAFSLGQGTVESEFWGEIRTRSYSYLALNHSQNGSENPFQVVVPVDAIHTVDILGSD